MFGSLVHEIAKSMEFLNGADTADSTQCGNGGGCRCGELAKSPLSFHILRSFVLGAIERTKLHLNR